MYGNGVESSMNWTVGPNRTAAAQGSRAFLRQQSLQQRSALRSLCHDSLWYVASKSLLRERRGGKKKTHRFSSTRHTRCTTCRSNSRNQSYAMLDFDTVGLLFAAAYPSNPTFPHKRLYFLQELNHAQSSSAATGPLQGANSVHRTCQVEQCTLIYCYGPRL